MGFDIPADSYDRLMGRFSVPLAARFVDRVDLRPEHRVLDVGCGPGALTTGRAEALPHDTSAYDACLAQLVVHFMTDPVAGLAATRQGHLGELMSAAGLREVEESALTVTVTFPTLEEWWEPFTLGVGPAGDHVARLDQGDRAALPEACGRQLPPAPFEISATAWFAAGRA